ncbi:spore-associated protein A [Streptosporangium sp. NPDC048047]|uniref:spore-associated protein A n=1 Tax=Streptosporangium sp. NPDC048047 TaxID=3155748 RepID=UPI00343620BC
MRRFKQAAVFTVATAVALASSVVMSSPAMAASSPTAACGGGSYRVIDSHAISGLATIYLLYNGSTNCVVTWKSSKYQGGYTLTGATIQRKGGSKISDTGSYKIYAGPVKVNAAGTCVSWGGHASNSAGVGEGWQSSWTHCG